MNENTNKQANQNLQKVSNESQFNLKQSVIQTVLELNKIPQKKKNDYMYYLKSISSFQSPKLAQNKIKDDEIQNINLKFPEYKKQESCNLSAKSEKNTEQNLSSQRNIEHLNSNLDLEYTQMKKQNNKKNKQESLVQNTKKLKEQKDSQLGVNQLGNNFYAKTQKKKNKKLLYQQQSIQKQQPLKKIYDEQQSAQYQYKQKKKTNSILKNNICNNFANFSEEKFNFITVKDYEGDLSWMTEYVIQNCEIQQLLDYQGTLEKNDIQSYINKLNLFQMFSNFNQNQFKFSKPFSTVNNQDKNQLETNQYENNVNQFNKLITQSNLYESCNKIEIDENKNNSEYYIENKDIIENKQQTHNENINDEINLLQQEFENQDEQQKLKLKQYIQQQNFQFQQNSSKFHNKNKQFINCIIRFFCQENLDMIKITNNLRKRIFKFLDDCRKTGIQYRERKKIEKTDKFSHSHYRLLFLTLNPESVQKICHIKQDFKLHKNLLDINLKYCAQSEEYFNEESIQQKINFINFLKRCIFEITMRYVYKKFQTCKKLWHTEYDYEYKAFQGLQQLIDGNCVMRF